MAKQRPGFQMIDLQIPLGANLVLLEALEIRKAVGVIPLPGLKYDDVSLTLGAQALSCGYNRFRPFGIKPFPGKGSCVHDGPLEDRVGAVIVIDVIFAILDDFGIAAAGIDRVRRAADFIRIGLGFAFDVADFLAAGLNFAVQGHLVAPIPGS